MSQDRLTGSNAHAIRGAFSNFLTGVTVVCTIDRNGRARGFTANSFTSVSLDPPLVLVCLAKTASSHDIFRQCDSFSVNVLSEQQRELSKVFASKSADKFSKVDIRSAATGAPVIAGCLSWFDCTVFDCVEAGDHIILVGRVESFLGGQGAPLGFWRGNYVTFEGDAEANRVNSQSGQQERRLACGQSQP
jgi:flavin-dependent trigonelline monooxygenase, reductase component